LSVPANAFDSDGHGRPHYLSETYQPKEVGFPSGRAAGKTDL